MSKVAIELYRAHRPQTLDEMVGQDDVIEVLDAWMEAKTVPHCILASGPSGTGKTTCFRILRKMLDCSDLDFKELNIADLRGIDNIRQIRQGLNLAPVGGSCKVYLLDECHRMTSDSQEALLKILEDTPRHVYFFLASTDPQKLKRTVITRCTHLKFRSLTKRELEDLLGIVYKKETGDDLSGPVAEKIAELSEGSARMALVLLHQVIELDMEDEDKIVEKLQNSNTQKQAIEICRALLKKNTSWKQMAEILKGVDEDPEQIRWMILGYMKNVALSGGGASSRAVEIIELCRDNWYDCKHAGLVSACYQAVR